MVSVPVLSSTIVSMTPLASSASCPLIRMPSVAPRPIPTISAVGVASPSAHGQAITSTAMPVANACCGGAPDSSQPAATTAATAITDGTNQVMTRSTVCWIRALRSCACSATAAIWASCVRAPTAVAVITSRPSVLIVPPITASPGRTTFGNDSPVTTLVSSAASPR